MRARSRWVSTPANGEFCRSSHPLSDRDVMASSSSSTGPSRSRAHSPSQRAATPRGCAALRRRRFARARRRVRSGSVTSRLATGWWSQRLRIWSLVSLPAVFFSLLEPQDVVETDSAVRSDRRVPQPPAVAEVDDVLPG